jgi:hypothetical protein
MIEMRAESEGVNFGDVPEAINALLQQGVVAYRTEKALADRLFRQALAADPGQLPTYFCLYKIHTYQGSLDEGLAVAQQGLEEAARQAGLSRDWKSWQRQDPIPDGAARFALYTLKAMAFIHLRRGESEAAGALLTKLAELDPSGVVGWPVVAALAEGAV